VKFEVEILDTDLRDRKVIIEMRSMVEKKMEELSDFARNNLPNEMNHLRSALEQVENQWLSWQRIRALNQLSLVLNVNRERFGDREWHDDNC
jgi:hypothetical protein